MKEIDNRLPTSVVTGIRIRVNLIMSICVCNCRSLDSRESTLVDNVPFFMIWTHEILQNASLCCTLHQLKFYFSHFYYLFGFSFVLYTFQDEKDMKIRELTAELQRERKRSAAYQEQLDMVLREMEEHSNHLSRNIDDIVQSVKEIESKRVA